MIAAACCLKTLLQQCKSSQAPPSGRGLAVNLSSAGSMTSIQASHPLTSSLPHPSPLSPCRVWRAAAAGDSPGLWSLHPAAVSRAGGAGARQPAETQAAARPSPPGLFRTAIQPLTALQVRPNTPLMPSVFQLFSSGTTWSLLVVPVRSSHVTSHVTSHMRRLPRRPSTQTH